MIQHQLIGTVQCGVHWYVLLLYHQPSDTVMPTPKSFDLQVITLWSFATGTGVMSHPVGNVRRENSWFFLLSLMWETSDYGGWLYETGRKRPWPTRGV